MEKFFKKKSKIFSKKKSTKKFKFFQIKNGKIFQKKIENYIKTNCKLNQKTSRKN